MGSTLDDPVDLGVRCEPFFHAVESLRTKLEKPDRPASLTTLKEARDQWLACRPDVSKLGERRIRVLCADEQTAIDPPFVRGISDRGDLHRKRRWLEALIGVYLNTWRRMDQPEQLERLLKDSIGLFQGRSRRVANVREIANGLFSSKAARLLAASIVTQQRPVSDALRGLDVSDNGSLGRAVASEAVWMWAEAITESSRINDGDAFVAEFRKGLARYFANEHVGHTALCRTVDSLVLWRSVEAIESLREVICNAVLQHPRLGDPRLLANRAQWDTCSPHTKDRVIRWLSRHDLAFFFDFVMDQTDDPHGRKAFWSRYIDQVADCSVALSPFDASRLRAQVKERVTHSRVVGTENVSAFLMRFKGAMNLIVVEFSQAGNALYVHDAEAFEAALPDGIRRSSFHLREELKRGGSMEEWMAHQVGWEYRMSSFLARYGIRPN